ncbi:MAG TPA: histone deacetylase [Candidatus Thermoplasmatota archaeon]|nr:histone deacetylase [Candidatus Thermoplasmatota archaeon]
MATLLYDPAFLKHDPGTHVESPRRLEAVLSTLQATGLAGRLRAAAPPDPPAGAIERIHSAEMLKTVETACDRGRPLDLDTPTSPGTWRAAQLAVGGAVEAARLALSGEPAFSLARPPGHHATPTSPMGFCLFNNAAIAAEWALREGGARRVAIFDPDVHHGNGTQDTFYDRDDVLFVSLHQSPLYPGTGHLDETGAGKGEGFTINLPVPPLTGEAACGQLFEEVVRPALREFRPDLLILSMGYDAHWRDPLGSLLLTANFYGRTVAALARDHPRVCAVLEGGYDALALGRSCAATLAALAGTALLFPEDVAPKEREVVPSTAPYRKVHGERWSVG